VRQDSDQGEGFTVVPWDPQENIRSVSAVEAVLSCGFLRCRPDRWFPGFAAQWIPLAHSLGIDLKILEVVPQMHLPENPGIGYSATVDGEPMSIFMDKEDSKILTDIMLPESSREAGDLMLEYMARRFVSSLALSWTSPESSEVKFDSERDPHQVACAGAIKIIVSVNHSQCIVWLGLGRILVEGLDRLWRRQIHSAALDGPDEVDVSLEVAELAVPPSMLVEYTKSGTVIDLETLISDSLLLRIDGKPWMPARLCNIDGKFGFEITEGAASARSVPEGATRISFELGRITVKGQVASELTQKGAIYQTDLPLNDEVDIVINSKKVKKAVLCNFEGKFAVSVK